MRFYFESEILLWKWDFTLEVNFTVKVRFYFGSELLLWKWDFTLEVRFYLKVRFYFESDILRWKWDINSWIKDFINEIKILSRNWDWPKKVRLALLGFHTRFFSCEFCKIFQNSFITEHVLVFLLFTCNLKLSCAN